MYSLHEPEGGLILEMLLRLLTPHNLLLLLAGAAVLRMSAEYLRRKTDRLPAFLLGTGSGIAALLLLHCYGDAGGFAPPLTVYTLFVSAVAGIPGVLLLYLFQII